MRRAFFLLLKVAVSALLLYFSLRAVHLETVGARLVAANPSWLAIAAALSVAQLVLLAVRWREIANAGTASLTWGAALQFTFIGNFFSQVLPSTVGGDAARIYLLARRGGGWAHAAYSVLIDRVVGVTVLAAIVIACLPWTLAIVHDPVARGVLMLIGFGALAGAAVFFSLAFLPARLAARIGPVRHLASASRMAWTLVRSGTSSSVLLATSLSIHVLTVALVWCCARAVAAPVGFELVLFLLPPVLLIATVPISIAGWGVRESSMVVAFGYAGLAQGDGLTLSILYG
ncbi:MAG: lysylphosphatidylglycerol synthase transmembrane domain-containing protein, partial [Sphingomicrobium sp.]